MALTACGGAGSTAPTPAQTIRAHNQSGSIEHVIIILQENRTMDYMMHFLPGADVASYGLNLKGEQVPLAQKSLADTFDIDHEHSSFVIAYNNGGMNGFNQEPNTCNVGHQHDCMYAYAPQSEVQPLLDLCAQYACADRMFQSNQGPSLPAHQYIIAGTSSAAGNYTDPSDTNPASSNPVGSGISGHGGGCDSDSGSRVYTIDPYGVEGDEVFPCFDHPVLADELDKAGVSWKFYQNGNGAGLWHSYDYIQHIRYGPDYKNVIFGSSNVITDIQTGNLAQVTWVMPSRDNSDHSGNDSTTGPSWVASIVNAVGQSQYWSSTAVFITWDDWGGWYDHVAPQIFNSYELGFRVPLIVVSPYAKTGYVSHTQHEFGSILKFTEETFGLPSLGYSDARADDLIDCFNFSKNPRHFRAIHTRYPLSHFLHEPIDKNGADTD
jgi:phospholipase C